MTGRRILLPALMVATAALLLHACADESLFTEGGGTPPNDDDGSSGSGASSAGGGSANTVGVGGNVTDATMASGPASSSSGVDDVCQPEPGDSMCGDCVKKGCCMELRACVNDADCLCWLQCATDGGNGFSCQQMCGFAPATWNAVEFCINLNCLLECST